MSARSEPARHSFSTPGMSTWSNHMRRVAWGFDSWSVLRVSWGIFVSRMALDVMKSILLSLLATWLDSSFFTPRATDGATTIRNVLFWNRVIQKVASSVVGASTIWRR